MTSRAGIRLFVEADLATGALPMSEDHAHYLRNVMRRGSGDEVHLFNGRDGEWLARIGGLDKRGGQFTVHKQVRAQETEDGPWLLIGAIKRVRLELIIEKATELGAARICPVTTLRTNTERLNRDRLTAIATEAAEQCARLTVPEIAPTVPLKNMLMDWPHKEELGDRRLYLLDETGAGTAMAAAFGAHPKNQGAALLIGPEGGFDQSELDAMRILPFVNALDLGKRILRAETAALAALACYQAIVGDGAKNGG
ncbi:MAG: ribosomal small subunit methyltransferase [Rhodospirillales bacterium]|jgi:16S rRNA (uracil1498-N3)-methyltransferase|nr:ribosomal small subunit methyltransferase [Rhodospirillales bacterium]